MGKRRTARGFRKHIRREKSRLRRMGKSDQEVAEAVQQLASGASIALTVAQTPDTKESPA